MRRMYNLGGIPASMAVLHGWMYWVDNKIPKTIRTDPATGKCNHNNPYCLASIDEVLERVRNFRCRHGLAFSFQREFRLTYVDLDDCRDPATGELTEFAAGIVRRLNSYTEVSVSGKGLHIVVRGQVEKPRMHTKTRWAGRQIEIKPFNFYMTVSGDRLDGTPTDVQDRQAELSQLYDEVFGQEAGPGSQPARRQPRVRNPPAPERSADGVDLSACDFSICRDLAKTGMTAVEIEELLKDHPAMDRPKWRDREDYRRRTIQAAVNSLCP